MPSSPRTSPTVVAVTATPARPGGTSISSIALKVVLLWPRRRRLRPALPWGLSWPPGAERIGAQSEARSDGDGRDRWGTDRCRRRRRRARHRCRDHRHPSALPATRSRLRGPADRSGRSRGRHVVLEPLSGGSLRLRELLVPVLLLGGAVAGLELVRALRRPGRDRGVPELRRGQARS